MSNTSGEDPSMERVRTWPAVLASLLACLGAVASGCVVGFSSPTQESLHHASLLPTEEDVPWFSSLVTLGALVGAPVAGWSVDYFGRRTSVMLLSIPHLSGWMLIIAATGKVTLFCGRVLTGISVGGASACVPLYIAEIAPKSVRGGLGACFQLSLGVGILGVFSLGIVLDYAWLAVASLGVVCVLTLSMAFMPETPRWLLRQRRHNEARRVLHWLLGSHEAANQQFTEISANLARAETSAGCRELAARGIMVPLALSVCLMFIQQCSGINAILFNTKDIFSKAGFKDANLPSVIVALVQVLATVISVFLADRLGRRVLLYISGLVMCASCTSYGLYDYLITKPDPVRLDLTPLALASIVVYRIGFAVGWGPVPWLIMSEIFPVRVRGMSSGIATFSTWLFAFLVTNQFLNLESAISVHGTFWLFAGIALSGVLFVAIFLPETRKRSLEQIERHFSGESRTNDPPSPESCAALIQKID